MMKKFITLALIPMLWIAAATNVSAKALTPEELFVDDIMSQFSISPTGEYIAYVSPAGNTDLLTIATLKDFKTLFNTQMGDKRFVGSIAWANDERLLIWPAKKYGKRERPYFTNELQAVNFDGSKNVKLWGYDGGIKSGKEVQRWGYFEYESKYKSDDDHIIISTIDGKYGRYGTKVLRKVNIYNGRIFDRERSSVRSAQFVVHNSEEAVMQWGTDEKWDNIVKFKDKAGKWQDLPDGKATTAVYTLDNENMMLKRNAGDNKYELVKFSRFTQKLELIASSQNIDLYPIFDRENVIIGYRSERNGKPYTVFFDEKSPESQLRRAIHNAFRGYQVRVSNGSKGGRKRIITVWSDVEPGKYYLYDADAPKAKISPITLNNDKIKRDRFAYMMPISFEARDGVKIQGYITEPNGSMGNSPMVVMVHGGPFGPRDRWGWDSEVQLLASQGYAVLQVNFRGSGGYGEEFEESGYRQWGKAMQDDVTDGTLWAIKQGFANKDKICIYGASYGGYAALMGVVKEPDLYKCAIGYVGVYDLPLEDEVGDINDTAEGRHFLKETRGDDMEDLIKHSPARHADKIKAGIFLVHGKMDERVPFEHFEAMAAALDKAGHPYESLVEVGEAHGFYSNKNRHTLYNKMLGFLKQYLK